MSTQQIQVEPPEPDEVGEPTEAEVADWFEAPPYGPTGAPWQWLTPQAARDVSRLSGYFHRLFDFSGDWFTASRDQPKYLAAFREHVLEVADLDDPVYVLHRQFEPYSAAFTTIEGFLDCWPRLRHLDDQIGYDLFPLGLDYWLEVAGTGTAHIARRAV